MEKRVVKKTPTQQWSQATPEKQIRHFNQNSSQGRGKIVLNPDAWVEYDYNVHPPNMVLKNRKTQKPETDSKTSPSKPDATVDTFSIGKYPTLRKIVDQIPKSEVGKEMDLHLVRNMEATFLWKNGGFEFS